MADDQRPSSHLGYRLLVGEEEDVLIEAEQMPAVAEAALDDILGAIDKDMAVHRQSDLWRQASAGLAVFADRARRDNDGTGCGHCVISQSRDSGRAWSKTTSPLMIICRTTE